jgi:predicted DNA-binding transcriptional regulator YafY
MIKRTPFVRYKLLLERLRAGNRPNLHDIQRYLSDHDYPISVRGILRDINALYSDFNIEITYVRKGNYYYIDDEYSPGLPGVLAYLEIAQAADTVIETFRDLKDFSRYVVFEYQGLGKGTEYLPLLFDATKSERMIALWHGTFQDQEEKQYTFAPQFFKQYRGRWYVIGTVLGIENPMVFSLDRIHRIEAISDSPQINRLDLSGYDDIVGVSLPKGKPVEVRFRTTSLQARYLEALPLHRSQRVVTRKPDSVEFSLKVIPNYELTQELLKLSESIQVLAPETLVSEIREILEKSLN